MSTELLTANPIKAEVGAMPETTGLNFFKEDPNLTFVLKNYLSKEEYDQALAPLTELGEVAGSRLDELSRIADKHTPELFTYNGKGEIINKVDYHPAYREMESIGYGKFGLAAMSHKPVLGFSTKLPHVLKYSFWYLFAQSEFGLACPMSMTDSAARVLTMYASEEMKQTYLPLMTSTNMDELYTCSQFMTEKQGGSDVGINKVEARKVGDQWEIWGDKWFCSNVSSDLGLVLARPEGASAGTKGLGMFLVPRRLPDGSLNKYRINRLKDKLGTRDMASGEIDFQGATAYVIGDLENGFKQMMSMVNASRLSNAVRSTAMMRRSFLEALVSARGRAAFGSAIAEKPLMKETLFELLLDSEASTAVTFFTAAVYDEADGGSEDAKRLSRILTPLLKGYVCKRARNSTSEGMEARGGNGYIEDWVEPKLVRDALLGSIWEGTTNIVSLDVLRSLVKVQAGDVFFNAVFSSTENLSNPLARQTGQVLQKISEKIEAQAKKVIALNGAEQELPMKQLMNRMYHVLAASLLLKEASAQITEQGSYRKLYMTLQYIHRYFLTNGFDDLSFSDSSLLEWFDAIVDWEQIPEKAVEGLLKKVQQSVAL